MPVRMFITAGTIADCSKACELVKGIDVEYLLGDKGYDSNDFIEKLEKNNVIPVILSRRNRKNPREYDKYLYRLSHLVENAFLKLKKWRSITSRYAKNTAPSYSGTYKMYRHFGRS